MRIMPDRRNDALTGNGNVPSSRMPLPYPPVDMERESHLYIAGNPDFHEYEDPEIRYENVEKKP